MCVYVQCVHVHCDLEGVLAAADISDLELQKEIPVSIHACMYVLICVCVCIHLCMYSCVYVHCESEQLRIYQIWNCKKIPVSMHACMHVRV